MYITKKTKNIRLGLSNREATLLSTLASKDKSIIKYDDVSGVVNTSYQNARKIVEVLYKKKWLVKIASGRYLISPLSAGVNSEYTEHEFVIASNLAKGRHYISYWSALNHYGYTEQTPSVVFMATTERTSNTVIQGVKYRFVTVNKTKFFGIQNHRIGRQEIMISDMDKTIADALDHPEYCGGIDEVAKCLWNARNDVSFKKIIKYSKKMNNSAIIKRLGYLIDILEINIGSSLYMQMHDMIKPGRSLLNPHSQRRKKSNAKWNLFVNISKDELLEAKSLT